MNKGLFIHLMVSIIYGCMVCFIVQGENTDVADRGFMMFFLAFINILVIPVCDANGFYKQKL